MQKQLLSSLLTGLCTITLSYVEAHNHNHTIVIVEQASTTLIVQNEPPANVVFVERATS